MLQLHDAGAEAIAARINSPFFFGEILSVTRQKVTMERTFAIIKPDAMRNGKAEDILRDIQNAGALHTR